MRNIFIYIFLFLLLSCNQKNKQEEIFEIKLDSNFTHVNESDFFDDNLSDSISLFVMDDICGEWGGPEEKIEIFSNSIGDKVLNYKKYKFNCDSIDFYYNSNPIFDYERSIILNDNEKSKISCFFEKLIKAKIQEKHGSNAGKIFHLQNSDTTLLISIVTDKTDISESFYLLKRDLKLTK